MSFIWHLTLTLTIFITAAVYDPTFCGDTPAPIVQHKIMGGKDANPEYFKNAVSLFHQKNFKCTASLIGSNVVLTAAHCFLDSNNPNTFLNQVCHNNVSCLANYNIANMTEEKCQFSFYSMPTIKQDFTVVVGAHPLDSNASHFGILDIDPSYARFYHRGCFQHDIAILKIADTEDAPYSCILPRSFVNLKGFVDTTSIGWGADPISGQRTHNDLQVFNPGNVKSRQDCAELTNDDMPIDGICVQEYSNKDACHGDSGGPLLTYHDHGRFLHRLVTLGTLSFGTNCEDLMTNYPAGGAVYTRLDFYNAMLDTALNLTGLYDDLDFSPDITLMTLADTAI